MRINEVERLVGVTKKNIRFYEEEGLLKPARNQENGYREYGDEDVRELRRIKLLRQLAVPLEEIRRLQTGESGLAACMAAQTEELETRARNTLQIKEVCSRMAAEGGTYAALDAEAWQQRITELEQTGTRFMPVEHDARQKMREPRGAAALLFVLLAAAEALLVWLLMGEKMALAFKLLILALPVGLAVAVAAVLLDRLQEIRKGEDDEAAQY